MADVTFEIGNGNFIYKVGAIIMFNGALLMVKNDYSPYYYPVGGRVRYGETSADAVLRETLEETGLALEIDRLAFIHENYFVADFMENTPCHEIAFYFLLKYSDEVENAVCNSYGYNNVKESIHWLPVNDLANHHLFPEFFKTELHSISDGIGHFITKNKRTYPACFAT